MNEKNPEWAVRYEQNNGCFSAMTLRAVSFDAVYEKLRERYPEMLRCVQSITKVKQ